MAPQSGSTTHSPAAATGSGSGLSAIQSSPAARRGDGSAIHRATLGCPRTSRRGPPLPFRTMSTDDDGDDDAVGRVPPLPPDDRLWRHPSEVSVVRSGARVGPASRRSPRPAGAAPVWPIALVGRLRRRGAVRRRPRPHRQPVGGRRAGDRAGEGHADRARRRRSPTTQSVDAAEGPGEPLRWCASASPARDGESEACGVVVRDDGIVVTSAHEVVGATAITVDARRRPAGRGRAGGRRPPHRRRRDHASTPAR